MVLHNKGAAAFMFVIDIHIFRLVAEFQVIDKEIHSQRFLIGLIFVTMHL